MALEHNFKFILDPIAYINGYIRSAMLAGAYSGYNVFYMHFAGLLGGFENLWVAID